MSTSGISVAIIGVALAALSATASFGQANSQPATVQSSLEAGAAAPKSDDVTNAEVRKVDKDGKKITLKHEAIKSLDMPGMTMVFKVKDATLLDNVKAGDKVKFRVISEGGAYIVTDLLPAK